MDIAENRAMKIMELNCRLGKDTEVRPRQKTKTELPES
jgi:hypothetical protein